MFRGLFGSSKNQSPSTPKNQIEVVCPACGAAQHEPRLVVSTFCKRCGVHLTIEKKRVVASQVSKAGGRPDALAPAKQPVAAPKPAEPERKFGAGPAAASGPMTVASALIPVANASTPVLEPERLSDLPDISETGELGLGMMMQAAVASPALMSQLAEPETPLAPAGLEQPEAVVTEVKEPAPPVQVEEPTPSPKTEEVETEAEAAKARVQPVAAEPVAPALAEAPITKEPEAPMPTTRVGDNVPGAVAEIMQAPVAAQGAIQRMMVQSAHRQQYFKEVECFECGHKLKVGRSARSGSCPSCGASISMEDIELNVPSTQPIKTRGDVLIRKRGHLAATDLFARDLRCYGGLQAAVHCQGDAIFRTEGTVVGEVNCRRFIVEKGSNITFVNAIHADDVEIHSPITGNIFARGAVHIFAKGAVNGDVSARSFSIEPGGELNGSMSIVRTAK